jgi:NADPH:quinone reductase
MPVVYDSVRKATFDITLKCLAPRGYFVSFGTTTSAPPPVEAATLQKLGSPYFTRPTLTNYAAKRDRAPFYNAHSLHRLSASA